LPANATRSRCGQEPIATGAGQIITLLAYKAAHSERSEEPRINFGWVLAEIAT